MNVRIFVEMNRIGALSWQGTSKKVFKEKSLSSGMIMEYTLNLQRKFSAQNQYFINWYARFNLKIT